MMAADNRLKETKSSVHSLLPVLARYCFHWIRTGRLHKSFVFTFFRGLSHLRYFHPRFNEGVRTSKRRKKLQSAVTVLPSCVRISGTR